MSTLAQLVAELNSGRLEIVDLTQPLGPDTPVIDLPPMFASSPGVSMEVISRFDDRGPAWYWNTIRMGEHTGTHFDAPVHWITGKDLPDNRCDTIPPARFIGPACVIDVTADVERNPDFLLMPEHVTRWEGTHGRIPKHSWVLLRTGWSKRTDPIAFLNMSTDGPHSPGFHASTSKLLAHDRDVLGVGVETVGTDAGAAHSFDPPFPCHAALMGSGKYGLTQLQNLAALPPTGTVLVAAPLPIVSGSGSPSRVLALVDRG